MTRKVKIVFLVLAILILLATCAFAAETQITLEGDNEASPGETKTITLKVSSEEIEVGVVSGKIEKSSNVESLTVTGKNNWNLTYNSETGVFNVYKAEGAKIEEILNIEYTLKNEEGIAKITISDIDLTTIDYETKEVNQISKEITVESKQENPGQEPETVTLTGIKIKSDPIKVTYTVGEKFNKAGLVVEAQYSDGTSKEVTNYTYEPAGDLKITDTKITIIYTEGEVTKTVEQLITVKAVTQENEPAEDDKKEDKEITADGDQKDTTQADKKFDKAGVEDYTFAIIAVIAIVAFVSYKKYQQYKNI